MTNNNNFAHPQYLVTSEWLVEKLQDNNLRIYDCTAHLLPHPTETYTIGSGRSDYDKAHIPGADFLDLQEELSDRDSRFRFTFPKAEDFAAAVGKKGLGNNNTIILYSTTSPQWATRIWWMLRAFGFYNAKVLDGGLVRWKQQGYPTSTEPAQYPHTTFIANLQDGLIADKDEVQNAVNDQTVCTVNALSRAQHTASGGAVYGRPGRISNSENVPTSSLVNPDTNMFLPLREISQKFSEIGADKADRVLTYCGGGIAASATAMLLVMLGYENVGLYDNSMSEWANKPDLPMETG
jgi:thiosulfate/3-mercaptopyruvate sulfurtransferase